MAEEKKDLHISRRHFLILFDEFSGVNSEKLDLFLDLASRRLDPSVWGDKIKEATGFLAAHMLSSTGGEGGTGGGVGGAITQQSTAQLSRSYSQVSTGNGNDETYALTRYGLQYLELRRACVIGATVSCPQKPALTKRSRKKNVIL